jgi:hypothetical protein
MEQELPPLVSPEQSRSDDADNDSATPPERSLNDVLEDISLGFFHYRLLVMAGLVFMADAMEVTLLSFIAICAGTHTYRKYL